jgi:hypothetical protein
MFSDGRIKAATNKTKQSTPVFWRGADGLNVAFAVGRQCLTVRLQNVMFQLTGWRVNCHRLMLNFAYSCLDHYREQLLTEVGSYEIAKQDGWIAYFGIFLLFKAFDVSPQNLIDCVYFSKK